MAQAPITGHGSQEEMGGFRGMLHQASPTFCTENHRPPHKKGKFLNLPASFQSIEDGQPFYTSCIFKDLFKQASQLLNKSDHPQCTKEGAES